MNKHHRPFVWLLALTLVWLGLDSPSLYGNHAGGPLFYRIVDGTTVEISGTDRFAIGDIEIPAVIEGKPVTSIASFAFQYGYFSSIRIPASVTNIGERAFAGAVRNNAFLVDPGNPNYVSQDGVIFNSSLTTLVAFPGRRGGAYTVPPSVTSIGMAFRMCPNVASVTLPPGLTSLPDFAFADCGGMTSVQLPPTITSVGYAGFFNCVGLTGINLPPSLTSLGTSAFYQCHGLISVILPSGLTAIGDSAFADCPKLTSAVFLGNAPSSVGTSLFFTYPAFSVYYLSTKTGFTSPTWKGYPAVEINESTYPAGAWLQGHGVPFATSLDADPDGDGLSLRLAWALDLAPGADLRSRLPGPVVGPLGMALQFLAARPGVIYRVETTTDLSLPWTTAGVSQPAPGPDRQVTATVSRNDPRRFMRLVVEP